VAGQPAPSDQESFARWVEPHFPILNRIVRWSVPVSSADDVVQDALLRAWDKRSLFDPSRGSPDAWLARIALDQCAQQHRRSRRWERADRLATTATTEPWPEVTNHLALRQAISTLNTRQQQAVVLYYFADMTAQDVAQTLGRPVSTVRSTLAAARLALKKTLGDQI